MFINARCILGDPMSAFEKAQQLFAIVTLSLGRLVPACPSSGNLSINSSGKGSVTALSVKRRWWKSTH